MTEPTQDKVRRLSGGFPRELYFHMFPLDSGDSTIRCRACRRKISLGFTEEEQGWIREGVNCPTEDLEIRRGQLIPKVFDVIKKHTEECEQKLRLRAMLMQMRDMGKIPIPILTGDTDESRRALNSFKDKVYSRFEGAGTRQLRSSFPKPGTRGPGSGEIG